MVILKRSPEGLCQTLFLVCPDCADSLTEAPGDSGPALLSSAPHPRWHHPLAHPQSLWSHRLTRPLHGLGFLSSPQAWEAVWTRCPGDAIAGKTHPRWLIGGRGSRTAQGPREGSWEPQPAWRGPGPASPGGCLLCSRTLPTFLRGPRAGVLGKTLPRNFGKSIPGGVAGGDVLGLPRLREALGSALLPTHRMATLTGCGSECPERCSKVPEDNLDLESGSWDQGSVAPHEGEDLRGLSVVGVAETRHCRVPGAGFGVGRGREPGLAPPPLRDPPPGLAGGQTPTEIWRRRPWGSAVGWSGKQLSTASVPGSPVAQRRPERRRRGTGFSALLPPLRSKLWHSHSLVPQIRVSDGAAGSKCPAADAGRRSTGTHTRFLPPSCTAGAQGAPGGPGGPP